MKMLWQENHSLHHRFTGLVAAGLDVAGVPPPDQPPTAVSKQLLWGLLSLWTWGRKAGLPGPRFPAGPGSHRLAGRSLFLVPLSQGDPNYRGASLCTQPGSGEGQQCCEFMVQCPVSGLS